MGQVPAQHVGNYGTPFGMFHSRTQVSRIRRHKVINLCCVNLSVAVNSPDTLLKVHRVPRQIVIEKNTRKLQVDALASRGGANQ